MPGGSRRIRCEWCWRKCAYADFRGAVPTTSGGRGAGPWGSFGSVGADQQRVLSEELASGVATTRGGVTRHTILGELHGHKRVLWARMTTECYYRGQDRPRTTEEALVMVERMSATEFRVTFLGMTVLQARAIRRSVTLEEFLRWWRSVGAQGVLDLYVGGEDLQGFVG